MGKNNNTKFGENIAVFDSQRGLISGRNEKDILLTFLAYTGVLTHAGRKRKSNDITVMLK